ncbi:TRAP-type small permease component [Sinorhizobium meliloti CCNWSX0020]|uniref:TRAP transporter small permease protein n=2 Tax=Sinorhizobium TaxID=28105 RepID=H0FTJ8_RHIML|nr:MULTISPECIES: TRAP transporter small permease [Sinorhizobium]EHK79536.1 TRAP-type small permease component [Sinorhizobium meliloti CCNWSX0020]RVE92213.1 TRAP transporter small permease [Sinorhizobium meliloti]RVG75718.1 TRAP transporter small permease [Sinorhizobium meliloti]RVH35055.1 TRAP transporter small permease [Sinorhizobium meliloti]WHS91130.1 TRAP transporter small permease [Sinorhizobium kummerowiae]
MNQSIAPPLYARAIVSLSEAMLALEKRAVAGLMCVLLALILLNVVTRYSGHPLYWVDEAAVYAMVWLAFFGGSALTRLRLDFAVTLLTDYLPPAAARWMRAASTLLVLLFALALAAFCWMWMDPVGIIRAGFDAKAFAAESFNFLYTERSQTLNWPIWAISLVIPLFAVTMTVHCAANLVEDLGLSPQRERRELSSAEGVN